MSQDTHPRNTTKVKLKEILRTSTLKKNQELLHKH